MDMTMTMTTATIITTTTTDMIITTATKNLRGIHPLLEQMVGFITVMMDWRLIPMNPFTLLASSAGELRLFLLEISLKELLPSVLVALLVLGRQL